jgi:hypothetical protein
MPTLASVIGAPLAERIAALYAWIEASPLAPLFTRDALAVAGALSVLMMVASLVVTPAILVRLRPDYFNHPKPHLLERLRTVPPLRAAGILARNVLGLFLVAAGILMLVLPGQGTLTILIGLLLIDFPRKREMERRVVSLPKVLETINWLRRRAGRAPIVVAPPQDDDLAR